MNFVKLWKKWYCIHRLWEATKSAQWLYCCKTVAWKSNKQRRGDRSCKKGTNIFGPCYPKIQERLLQVWAVFEQFKEQRFSPKWFPTTRVITNWASSMLFWGEFSSESVSFQTTKAWSKACAIWGKVCQSQAVCQCQSSTATWARSNNFSGLTAVIYSWALGEESKESFRTYCWSGLRSNYIIKNSRYFTLSLI